MLYSEQHIAQLVLKHFSDDLSPSEHAELENWLSESPQNRHFFEELDGEDYLIHLLKLEESDRKNNVQQKILQKIQEKIQVPGNYEDSHRVKSIPRFPGFHRRIWFAAAAIIILVSTGIFLWGIMSGSEKKQQKPLAVTPANDILPGINRALLTLSDGRQVELDPGNGEVIMDGNLQITNDDGELKYTQPGEAVLNTMTTPKGGQYKITLADRSKVWLNAASSITYPTVFKGNKREVSVTGEVYFEVEQDKTKPFIVQTPGGSHIEVLGTHFNVNTYGDEAYQTTTLIEGKVRVVKLPENVNLRPGMRAKMINSENSQETKNIIVEEADVEEAIGWKNNLFVFNKADIPFIMRQLSRWYDLDIRYKGEVPKRSFLGKIPRNIPLSQMLGALKLAGVNFEIKDKTLIVSGSTNE